jgi:ketosteroid isomerase-like protein
MKRFGLTIALTLTAFVLLWSTTFNTRAAGDPKTEITEIEQKALAASTASELLAFYDPKDIITYDYIPGLQYVGAKAVYADVDHFFSNTKNLKGNFVDLQVETDGTMGVAHSLQHFTWIDNSGAQQEATFRVTNCYHKTNGQWKIFHMHTSFPVDPVTWKAQTNLKE